MAISVGEMGGARNADLVDISHGMRVLVSRFGRKVLGHVIETPGKCEATRQASFLVQPDETLFGNGNNAVQVVSQSELLEGSAVIYAAETELPPQELFAAAVVEQDQLFQI